jgi:glycosyltransferase involved in cell wall biosynthesis
METRPKVSIGLAVYNGEQYLEQAVDSLLAQTFTDFELIISDNASTDRTPEICQKYAAQDPRVRYHRNATNIGGANNENLTFKLSKGEYFRWAAHDDLCAPELLEKCVAVLESHPEIVLCHSQMVEMVEGITRNKTTDNRLGEKPEPYLRFGELSRRNHSCEATYGVIRADVMRKTPLQKNYTGSDRVFLAELSLYGPFYQVPEPLFYKRFHTKNLLVDWRTRMAWFDTAYVGKIVYPNWLEFFDYLSVINRVPSSFKTKIRCYLHMLGPWLWENWKFMAKDILVALNMMVHSAEWRKKRYESTNNWS